MSIGQSRDRRMAFGIDHFIELALSDLPLTDLCYKIVLNDDFRVLKQSGIISVENIGIFNQDLFHKVFPS